MRDFLRKIAGAFSSGGSPAKDATSLAPAEDPPEPPAIVPVKYIDLVNAISIQERQRLEHTGLAKLLLDTSMAEHDHHVTLEILEEDLQAELAKVREKYGVAEEYKLAMPAKKGEHGKLVHPDHLPKSAAE